MCYVMRDDDVGFYDVESCDNVKNLECQLDNARLAAQDLLACLYYDTTIDTEVLAGCMSDFCRVLEVKQPPKEVVKERSAYFELGIQLSKKALTH